jgi:hypothetical protein
VVTRKEGRQKKRNAGNNLGSNPVHFSTCVSSFRKWDIELEVDGNYLSQPREGAEAFAEYFKTSYNNAYVGEPSSASRSADSLSLVCVPDS